ncbi:hypothetical protein EFP66_14660 [Lacticaseibacillus paracasei]|nr:hypothetical protein [Lacticaseibacillus paracasei]RDV42308.1 hypothetical protein DQM07_03625 [Lacticaseibacillus paracasei subsp. paracasei]MCT3317430.1 hypothetical protein [Lacticaseibacillus paracasei]MCT3338230.1 hypothetical protein [Lacticaseibacillus paracasei]MCT3344869.1 hypothetical protein [Lacticaseibacillus paracasei]
MKVKKLLTTLSSLQRMVLQDPRTKILKSFNLQFHHEMHKEPPSFLMGLFLFHQWKIDVITF